jgi:putative endonuclease
VHTADVTREAAQMFHVYILTNRMHGTLYTGVTNDLAGRIDLHRRGLGSEFVKKYALFRLVYAALFDDVAEAIAYEKTAEKMEAGLENPVDRKT